MYRLTERRKWIFIGILITALLTVVLVIAVFCRLAFPMEIRGDKVILSKEELIELSKTIQELEAKLEKAEKELSLYKVALEVERELNKAEVGKLEELIKLKEEQIRVYKEMLALYKEWRDTAIKELNKAKRDKTLQNILFLILGVLIGKVI